MVVLVVFALCYLPISVLNVMKRYQSLELLRLGLKALKTKLLQSVRTYIKSSLILVTDASY